MYSSDFMHNSTLDMLLRWTPFKKLDEMRHFSRFPASRIRQLL